MTTALASLLAAGLGAVLCRPAPGRQVVARLPELGAHPRRGRRLPSAVLATPPVVGCLLAALAWVGPSSLLLTATLGLVVGGGWWLRGAARARRSAQFRRREVIEICDAVCAELRAGQPAATAVARVAEHHAPLSPVARACALGGDVTVAWRRLARAPGAEGFRTMAAAWQMAEGTGSGLAVAVGRVTESLRGDAATRAEVAAALAPARSTARLLAVLPVFGLALGSGLGGDPVGLLLTTFAGSLLLFAGVVLTLAGTVWVERLARAVETSC